MDGAEVSLRRIAAGLGPATLVVQTCSFASSVALATLLGATAETDAYYLALSVPVLVYGVLLAGIRLGAIPVLTDVNAVGDREYNRACGELVGATFLGSALLGVVVTAASYWGLPLVSGGADADAIAQAQELILKLAPMTILGALAGALGAILTVRGRYIAPVLVGVFEPLSKLVLLVAFAESLGADALVLGNVLGGVLAVAVMWGIAENAGIRIRATLALRSPFVRTVAAVAGPLAVAEAVLQINPIIDRLTAAPLGSGAVTVLELGLRLFSVPTIALASILIAPVIAVWSARFAAGGWPALRGSMLAALRLALLALPPIVVLGVLARHEIVSVLYEAGNFSSEAANDTADVFGLFIVGLPAQVLVVAGASLFIVQKETYIPMFIALANVVLNVILDVWFSSLFGVAGIALATSVTMTTLLIAYFVLARHRYGALQLATLYPTALRVAAATCAASLAGVWFMWQLPAASARTETGLGILALIAIVGGVYFGVLRVLGGSDGWARRKSERSA